MVNSHPLRNNPSKSMNDMISTFLAELFRMPLLFWLAIWSTIQLSYRPCRGAPTNAYSRLAIHTHQWIWQNALLRKAALGLELKSIFFQKTFKAFRSSTFEYKSSLSRPF